MAAAKSLDNCHCERSEAIPTAQESALGLASSRGCTASARSSQRQGSADFAAIRVNNLGLVLKDPGDLQGARQALKRALEIFEQVLPADHPSIRTVRGNLERVERELGS